jgi:tetratricopeptide (TPR) repeat protein
LRENAQEQQLHGVGEVMRAGKAIRDTLRPDPVARAWEMIQHGKFEDALAESRKIAATDGRAYNASLAESYALRQLRRLEEAEAILVRAIGLRRRTPHAHIQLAWLRFDQRRFDEVLVVAKEAERLIAESGQLREAPGLAHLTARALFFQGRKEEALARLRQIPPDHELAFDAALTEAWFWRDLGRCEEAEAAIARAETIRPQAVGWLIERAWLRVHQQRIEDGLRDAERAGELVAAGQEEHLGSVCHLMTALCHMGNRLPQAEEWAAKAIAEHPGNADFLVQRARILASLGRHDEAIDDARAALAMAPDHAGAHAFLLPA